MRIKEIISLKVKELENDPEALLKVRLLIMDILNVQKEYLLIHYNDEFPKNKIQMLEENIKRLKNNEPIQYILNKQNFFGLEFYVDENVLIPQPDTEILVEECISILKNVENNPQRFFANKKENLKILDLCTGSGAIGVSLAKNIKNSQVFVSDISKLALEIAKKNATQNEVEIICMESDLFENINEQFDMIVSNPPYIETDIIKTLSNEVQKEPILALDGGIDGLKFYRKIAEQEKKYLKDNGYLALEIGYNQKESVEKILQENGYKNIYCKKDLGGNNRVIVAQK